MLELEIYSFMKIFLNPELQVITFLWEGPHVLSLRPIPVTHSDGALQNFKVPSASLELQSNLWIK